MAFFFDPVSRLMQLLRTHQIWVYQKIRGPHSHQLESHNIKTSMIRLFGYKISLSAQFQKGTLELDSVC